MIKRIISVFMTALLVLLCGACGQSFPTEDGNMIFDRVHIPGYARFRIPGVVTTAKGTLLAYCEARRNDGDWADIDILLRRSTDGGQSFSEPVVLADGTQNKQTVNNPVMIAGHDGTAHLLYCVEYGVEERGGGVFYRKSADDGMTWSEPLDISAMTSPELRNVFATGPGHGIELADGTLFVPCWTVLKEHGKKTDSHHPGTVCALTSSDGGETWRITSFVPNGEVSDPNETAAAQLPDGTVVLNVRDGDVKKRCYSISVDGVTFSPIAVSEDVPDPVCCGGMAVAGDMLYLTHCRDTKKRQNLTLEQSADGVHWQTVQILDPGDAGYSDVTFYNGTLFIAYEKGTAVAMTTVPL